MSDKDTIYRQDAIDAIETVGYDFSDSGLSEIDFCPNCGADMRQRKEEHDESE